MYFNKVLVFGNNVLIKKTIQIDINEYLHLSIFEGFVIILYKYIMLRYIFAFGSISFVGINSALCYTIFTKGKVKEES